MTERPIITVSFQALPRVDGMVAIRALLKTALRSFGLRCTRIKLEAPPTPDPEPEATP